MPKPIPKRSVPFDIFGDERLGAAMQAATSPGTRTREEKLPEVEAPAPSVEASEEGKEQNAPHPLKRKPPTREKPEASDVTAPTRADGLSEKGKEQNAPYPSKRETSERGKRSRSGQPAASPASDVEDHVPLKFEVPRSMRAEFQAFRAELGAALGGIALDNSNIGRAVLARLLGPDRPRVLDAARKAGALRRPRNDDLNAMAAFDLRLKGLFGVDD